MAVFVLLRRAAHFVFGSDAPVHHDASAYANAHVPAFWYLHGR